MERSAEPQDQPEPGDGGPEDDLDLASLGLAVFFISVIGIVIALLVVQNLL
jgi:hypothetical protein